MSRNSVEFMGMPEELLYWVHGEMVVIVRLPRRPAEDLLDKLVEQVRSQLNEILAQYHITLEQYGTAGRWSSARAMPPIRRRSFIFGLHRQQPLAALFFHAVHADAGVRDPMPMAISYIQSNLEQLAQLGLHVVSAMPNWLITAAPLLYAEGGPAMPPHAAPMLDVPGVGSGSPGWHITFADQDLLDPNEAEDVMVAVLDTAPHADSVYGAATRNGYRRNWLLQRLASDLRDENGSFEIEYDRYPLTSDVRTGRNLYNDPRYFFMTDHGLFVSGLIRDVAPRARIRLIRILNDFGGSDLYTLFAALTDLEQELVSGAIRRLVINLSFTILPDVRRLPFIWFDHRQWPSARLTGALRILNHIEDGLRLLCESLFAHGALIVAAAGNDSVESNRKGQRPRPPRAPARYETTLSVSSVNSRFVPSIFANAAALPPFNTGVATFGGDIYESIDANGLPDAVRGVCISPVFPGGEPNINGWADWSGSSFATAIISGLGAHLMAQGWSAANTMTRIASIQERPGSTLFGAPPDALDLHANIVRVQQRFGL